MNTEITGICVLFAATLLCAFPFGKYMAAVYAGKPTVLDFISPVEKALFKLCGLNPQRGMSPKQHILAALSINLIWFLWAMALFLTQDYHFLNPDHIPSMKPDLAFNTAVSFLVNCNLQHYSGETGLSYLSQTAGVIFLQFVSAATGMALCVTLFHSFKQGSFTEAGNFWNYFVKSCTRILLPVSLVLALILVFKGSPATYKGAQHYVSLQGDSVSVSAGPVAPLVAIKELGTNGGGFFGANSAHPFENPDYLTNLLENFALMLIPLSMVFAIGFFVNRKKLSFMIIGVMSVGFLLLLIPTVVTEMQGNPALSHLGISQAGGSLEGKDVRFGAAASAYWLISNTVISCGSVNSMADSFTPLSGLTALLGMMTNAFYGGCGVGILNFYVFIIIAVFISGLMVGRTPELNGKKVEGREMKIAVLTALLHPFLILAGTAIAAYNLTLHPEYSWLNNPGFHGFSEMLYEFTSAAANNGSGFEGLGDNSPFWNISTGFVMLLGRFIPIIGPVAIGGLLMQKKYIPESAGTLGTETATFGVMVLAVILIIAALAFFPALVIGPVAEFFS